MSFSPFPSHYYVHVHLRDDTSCFWYVVDGHEILLRKEILSAEAVPIEKLPEVCTKISRRYDTALIEACPCTNHALTDSVKKLLRVV